MPFSCLWCISKKTLFNSDSDDVRGESLSRKAEVEAAVNGTSTALKDSNADTLFDSYADASNRETMGVDGLTQLCKDSGIPFDGAQPLLFAWQLKQEEFGVILRENWVAYLEEMRICTLEGLAELLTDLENLLIQRWPPLQRPALQSSKSGKSKSGKSDAAGDKYLKDRYWAYSSRIEETFQDFYNFLFKFVQRPGARIIEIEYATAFWAVTLAPTCTIVSEINEFIAEKGTYKKATKDLWSMMLVFCRTVKPDLEGYDAEEEAWPSLFDDFVEWKREKMGITRGNSSEEAMY